MDIFHKSDLMIIQEVYLLVSERAFNIEDIAGEKITPAAAWKTA